MPVSVDLLILGAGIQGLALLWELSPDYSTLLLDPDPALSELVFDGAATYRCLRRPWEQRIHRGAREVSVALANALSTAAVAEAGLRLRVMIRPPHRQSQPTAETSPKLVANKGQRRDLHWRDWTDFAAEIAYSRGPGDDSNGD